MFVDRRRKPSLPSGRTTPGSSLSRRRRLWLLVWTSPLSLATGPVRPGRRGRWKEGGREEEREGLGHLTTICPVIHLLTGLSPCTLLYVTSVSVITVYEWTEPVGPRHLGIPQRSGRQENSWSRIQTKMRSNPVEDRGR